jgi:hypothetical protein
LLICFVAAVATSNAGNTARAALTMLNAQGYAVAVEAGMQPEGFLPAD